MQANFCRIPKRQLSAAARAGSRWRPGYEITWAIDSRTRIGPFERLDLIEIFEAVWNSYGTIGNIRHKFLSNSRSANIRIQSGRIDGRGNVLAEAQLPRFDAAESERLWLRVDTSEEWANATNPPQMVQDIFSVGWHEIGHNLGMEHAPRGSMNRMAPTAHRTRIPIGVWDREEIVKRYDVPATAKDQDVELFVFQAKVLGFDLADLLNLETGNGTRTNARRATSRSGATA